MAATTINIEIAASERGDNFGINMTDLLLKAPGPIKATAAWLKK
jgi:hypothetical protein